MLNPQQLLIDSFLNELNDAYHQTYSIKEPDLGHIIVWAGRLSLENIANSDALYHNLEHTMMVTLVGQAIMQGKHLVDGGVTPRDWLHMTLALLFHDIGYVRGVCRDDRPNAYATGVNGEIVELPPGGTDVALTPYHVDRSKLFVRERFGGRVMFDVDADLIASYIEMTRYPVPDHPTYRDTKNYPGLVRASDFIGQLGDPNYLRKIPALFYEFEETGVNARIGYKTPGDMRHKFAKFYWNEIRPYLDQAFRYLRVTQVGKQWVANLNAHIFDIEHELD